VTLVLINKSQVYGDNPSKNRFDIDVMHAYISKAFKVEVVEKGVRNE
jgi:hypothetical protein